MTNAVRYSLQHEVALHPNLTGESLAALRRFLKVLAAHFPADVPAVRESLSMLQSWVSAQDSVTADEWTGFFDKVGLNKIDK
jgi:hypothetical protein